MQFLIDDDYINDLNDNESLSDPFEDFDEEEEPENEYIDPKKVNSGEMSLIEVVETICEHNNDLAMNPSELAKDVVEQYLVGVDYNSIQRLVNSFDESTLMDVDPKYEELAKRIIGYFTSIGAELALEDGCAFVVESESVPFIGIEMGDGEIIVSSDAGDCMGFRMENGEITVDGSAGDNVGREMENGSITISGDCGNNLGYKMNDGEISVSGDAGNFVGSHIAGGEITIGGDVENNLGYKMKDGEINIGGNAGDNVGFSMENGEIHISGTAGENVGNKKTGGEIIISGK